MSKFFTPIEKQIEGMGKTELIEFLSRARKQLILIFVGFSILMMVCLVWYNIYFYSVGEPDTRGKLLFLAGTGVSVIGMAFCCFRNLKLLIAKAIIDFKDRKI